MNCRWSGADQPRVVIGRHDEDCTENGCRGCLPCPENHCGRCYREHVGSDYTCPGCIADARDDLAEIGRLCAALPAEVVHRGINSEAMNLLGPVADPESIGHVRASINVGRIDEGWLEVADNDHHPLLVLGTWWEAYAEALEHTEPGRIVVRDATAYLNRHLHTIAQLADVPFADFAVGLSRCRRHLERVLKDDREPEYAEGVTCLTCGRTPQRRTMEQGEEDAWWCPGCRRHLSPHEFYLAAAEQARMSADTLRAEILGND